MALTSCGILRDSEPADKIAASSEADATELTEASADSEATEATEASEDSAETENVQTEQGGELPEEKDNITVITIKNL